MLDYITYLTAQQRTATHVLEALPASPVRSDDQGGIFRHQFSATLRRFADWLEPAPAGSAREPANAHC